MAKKAACRCKETECEECPEWIFTFADLVMLMMGFFVILWVLKPSGNPKPASSSNAQDASEWIKAAASIREAFGYIPNPASKDPVDVQMMLKKMQVMKIPVGPGQGGKTMVRPDGPQGTDPEVTSIRQGKHAVIGGRLVFDKGNASPTAAMQRTLDQVAEQIRGHRNIVVIKGHTALDDLPETSTPQQRLDLSIRRAQAVADYLTSKNVEPDILRVQGCSTFEPVVQRNYAADSQSMNRRVEVESTASLVGDFQQQGETGKTGPSEPAMESPIESKKD